MSQSSSSLEKGFEANTQVHAMFMPVPQRQLVDEDRPQREAPGVGQAFRRYLPVPIEDPFELFIEILTRSRAQLMEDPPHFDPTLRVRRAPVPRRDQFALVLRAQLPQFGRVVVAIPQDVAYLGRDPAEQGGG